MSEMEYHIGRATPVVIPENVTVEQFCEILCGKLNISKDSYDSYKEALVSENDHYFVHENTQTLYKVFDKHMSEDDFSHAEEDYDGNVDYAVGYYNGGCSFNEALDAAIDELYGPFLRIHFNTGTAFGNSIVVKGTANDDLLDLVEGYINENGTDWTATFSYKELYDLYKDDTLTDTSVDDLISESYMPINGGEYYIYNIVRVEMA